VSYAYQIADAISDVAVWQSVEAADDESQLPSAFEYWPQLIEVLWEAANSDSLSRRESALRVLRDVPRVFGSHILSYQAEIKALIAASLDPAHGSMALLATAAGVVTAFVQVRLTDLSLFWSLPAGCRGQAAEHAVH
jgi:hypothetical protein